MIQKDGSSLASPFPPSHTTECRWQEMIQESLDLLTPSCIEMDSCRLKSEYANMLFACSFHRVNIPNSDSILFIHALIYSKGCFSADLADANATEVPTVVGFHSTVVTFSAFPTLLVILTLVSWPSPLSTSHFPRQRGPGRIRYWISATSCSWVSMV